MCAIGNSVLILGCGYTGLRVARRLLERGVEVLATSRDPASPAMVRLGAAGARVLRFDVSDADSFAPLRSELRRGAMVLHSLPTLGATGAFWDATPAVLELLGECPSRVVYLSSTGVYGDIRDVDETTVAPAPVNDRQRLRLDAEQAVVAGPWSSLILRPAAIYGPGRGVHVRLREGTFKLLGDGSNFISRIYVEDLSRIVVAGLFSAVTGVFPVADDEPCSSLEIVAFCADLLGLPMPPSAAAEELDETRRSNRRVDGRAIRRLLEMELEYPSYRVGVPAAIEAEGESRSSSRGRR